MANLGQSLSLQHTLALPCLPDYQFPVTHQLPRLLTWVELYRLDIVCRCLFKIAQMEVCMRAHVQGCRQERNGGRV